MTPLQWETTLAKVSSIIDSIPMAKGRQTNAEDLGYDLLTPNRLKMGRNDARSMLEGSKFVVNNLPSEILEQNRSITDNYHKLLTERIHHLVLKPNKWNQTQEKLPEKGDIVLFILNDSSTGDEWKLGRILETGETKAKIVYSRKCERTNTLKLNTVERSLRDVSVIVSESEIPMNSEQYRRQL